MPTETAMIEPLEARELFSATMHPAVKVIVPRYVNGAHVYADGTFKDANWQTTAVGVGSGGVSDGVQVKTGGAPGAYRSVTDVVDSGSSDSVIYGFHGNTKAIFNPATQGAITQLNYSESNKLISGYGQGERTGAALEQNGQIYFLLDLVYDIPQSKWEKIKATKLTAADFTTADGTEHPDFSQAGAPIEFGFYRANSAGYSGYSIVAGMDNWVVAVKTRKEIL